MAILGRQGGIERIWLTKVEVGGVVGSDGWKEVEWTENSECYSCSSDRNMVYNAKTIRLGYSSFITPKQILEVDMSTCKVSEVLKQQEIPNYDPTKYMSKRFEVAAQDGTMIPVSAVWNKDAAVCGSNILKPTKPSPCLLYGYGSYGACIDPTFDFKRLALLDRGVVYCIAHIRGGGEMGRPWYEEQGKYLTKKNTFTDFGNVAEGLAKIGITTAKQLAVVGRSAGGLLIGATLNMFPNLFTCAVADVPFVDVITTMSDPSIPLTVVEFEEWGCPNEEKYFEYMKSYSPVDNVREGAVYPNILVTAGLHDPRVGFWEPAKWVATIREKANTRESGSILFKTDLSSGHFSASDRYKYIKETAFEYSFIVDKIGAK
jgi:oligopeptidase B